VKKLLKYFRQLLYPPIGKEVQALIAEIRSSNLTYCGYPKLENLARAALHVRRRGISGQFLEAGVALGGSAILLAKLKGLRPLKLYDVFGLIPEPSVRDGEDAHSRYREIASGQAKGLGGNVYYGYVGDLPRRVVENLESFGINIATAQIELIQGLFSNTLHPAGPVALAHIDCDWYEAVKLCIDRISPHLCSGALIAFDDYNSYSGCRVAVDEWLANDNTIEVFLKDRSIVIRKK
jgi:hypothetical protein